MGLTLQDMQHEGQDQTSRGTLPSLIQTGEGFLLKLELGLSLSWLTLPRLVLGSACALVFSLVLVLHLLGKVEHQVQAEFKLQEETFTCLNQTGESSS